MADFLDRAKAAGAQVVTIVGEFVSEDADALILRGRRSLFEIPKSKIISHAEKETPEEGKQVVVRVGHDAEILQTFSRPAASLASEPGLPSDPERRNREIAADCARCDCECRCQCQCDCNCQCDSDCGGDHSDCGGDPGDCVTAAPGFPRRRSRFRRTM